jgi:hypothetical protein
MHLLNRLTVLALAGLLCSVAVAQQTQATTVPAVPNLIRFAGSFHLANPLAGLGQSLMEQAKFVEAEPLLIDGYRGLAEHRSVLPSGVSLREAGERIVRLLHSLGKVRQGGGMAQGVANRGSRSTIAELRRGSVSQIAAAGTLVYRLSPA